jgi:hypothetical protein
MLTYTNDYNDNIDHIQQLNTVIHPAQQAGALHDAIALIRQIADNEYTDQRNARARTEARQIIAAVDNAAALYAALSDMDHCAAGGIVHDVAPSYKMDMALCRDAAHAAISRYLGIK